MGYYSEVALATRKKWFDEMLRMAETEEYSEDILRLMLTLPDCSIDGEGESAVVILHWGDIKWYGDFASVMYIERWMNGEFNDEFEYAFARVGEDTCDMEDRYSEDYELYEYVQLSRTIWIGGFGKPFIPEMPSDGPEKDIELPEGSDVDLNDYLGT